MSLAQSDASTRRLERLAGWLFLATAGVHGFLTPAHFEEWWGYGLFFLASGVLQAVWGLAFLTHAVNPEDAGDKWHGLRTGLLALGFLGTAAVLALYIVTRTTGIPWFGPEAGVVEEVAPIDVVAKGAELALLVVLAMLWRRHAQSPRPTSA